MSKLRNNQAGFSGVEAVLILIIVGLVGVVGCMVYKDHHKTAIASVTTAKSAKIASPASTDPTAGWSTYTLKYEKLTFQYPSTWTIQDSSGNQGLTPNTDSVTLTANDGFSVNIDDGWDGSGDSLNVDTDSTIPVKFIGNSDYLVFLHPRETGGPANPNQNSLVSAILMTDPSSQYDQGSIANYFPQDKNAQGNPDINNGGSTMLISGGYAGSKTFATVSQAANDSEYKDFVLVLQSMHY